MRPKGGQASKLTAVNGDGGRSWVGMQQSYYHRCRRVRGTGRMERHRSLLILPCCCRTICVQQQRYALLGCLVGRGDVQR